VAGQRARTTAHEIGHQFNIAVNVEDEHREPPDYPHNLMSGSTASVPEAQFYLHAIDIAKLRDRVTSP
jgi:hypothetical protein